MRTFTTRLTMLLKPTSSMLISPFWSIIGPNGAGKTTTFAMMAGYVRPDQGRVLLDEKDVSQVPMHKRARMGVGYLAQEPSIFRKLTVEENIMSVLETLI